MICPLDERGVLNVELTHASIVRGLKCAGDVER